MLTVLSEDFSVSSLRNEVKRAVLAKQKCILLVPEQETLHAEAVMTELLPPHAPLYFEVTNFSRLANTVFRSLGGISYRYADKATSALIMWKALDAVAPLLEAPVTADSGRVREMLSALSELYAAEVDEAALEAAARQLPEGEGLRERISDLALILQTYKGELADKFGSHAEDLDRLGALLREVSFFQDTAFYIDSFTSFTAQEYRILGELIRQTDVAVALTLKEDDTPSLCYEETEDTARRLLSLAADAGIRAERKTGMRADMPPAILHAKRHLFRADKKSVPFEGDSEALALWQCADPFDASKKIASDIAARVRRGARYRDFVVFARSADAYRGILDAALERQGIPCFTSASKDIFSFAVIKMIMTAYAVLTKGCRREDVICLLKCGFGDFSADDVDYFELYTDFWHIEGRAFLKADGWSMNPDGYSDKLPERGAKILARVNALREKLFTPLLHLRDATADTASVLEHARALYAFLREMRAEERLRALAAQQRAAGNTAEGDTLSRLFPMICELLDRAVESIGELPVSRERFLDLLSILFSSVGLGQLPTSQDAVSIGNADMLRADGVRFVYLLGANDGEFPASVKSGGAFADSEREALCALGLPIAFDPLLKASREEFCFLRALCAAKERATVVSFRTDASGTAVYPSLAFLRLEEMFSTASTVTQEEAYSPLAGVEALGEIADAAKEKALLSLLSENADTHRATLGAQTPISDTECEIPADLARTLFGKELRLTQSRLDSYANCPFAYYCRYLLSLSEKTDSSFDFADIGSLIHALLENLFEVLGADGKTIRTVEKEEIPLYAERVCRSYIDAICPREMKDSPRLSHLFSRLSRTASLLCEELYDEFSQSKFDPAFFEFAIGKEGAPRPIVFEDGEGGRLSLYGVVDRIDTYRAEDGKLYLRVIDYKTGTKKFSIRDVAKGRNLQMLVYLFSLWKSKDKPFLDSLGLKEGETPLPAGMLYMSASPKDIKLDAPLSADEVKARAKESLARSGLVLEDESIVRAMDATLSGHYVPLTLSKDGSIKWDDRFASLERMGSLLSQMQDAVLSIGKGMRRGRAHAAPASVRDAGRDVCENCSFRAVCRRA